MGQLTVFDGHETVGGTKIVLSDSDTDLVLDFGLNYARMNQFYEEYLQPRSSRGIVDYIAMELLPRIGNFYREDLFPTPDFPQGNTTWPGRRPAAVLLSHGHIDHAGAVSFLHPDIPLVASPLTVALLRAWQEGGGHSLLSEVTYCSARSPSREDPRLLEPQRGRPKVGRNFALTSEAGSEFRELLSRSPLSGQNSEYRPGHLERFSGRVGNLCVRACPVDHSVYGAHGFLVETDGTLVAYTGDLRFHGERGADTEDFVQRLVSQRPEILIVEGTRLRGDPKEDEGPRTTEEEVRRTCEADVRQYEGRLVVADFGPRNVERLKTFRAIAANTGRQLVLVPKDAYLLHLMGAVDPKIPRDLSPNGMRILREPTLRGSSWMDLVERAYFSAYLDPSDVVKNPARWILCFSFFDANDLVDLYKGCANGLWLYSSSEAHGEEQEFDFHRLEAWIRWARMKQVGFQLVSNGRGGRKVCFDRPEDRGRHASGHMPESDLQQLVLRIRPRRVVPVHTQYPHAYERLLENSGISLELPAPGRPVVW
jgi:ribonuclease J